jgi:hypothetical protein
VVVALVLIATVLPFGPPALGAEAVWLLARFPRMLDWSELRRDAAVLPPAADRGRLVHGYAVYVVSGLAAWRNIEGERGHWIEVQPRPDPADDVSAGDKIYVLALPPDDPELHALAARGWLEVHGGGAWSTVLDLGPRPTLADAHRNWLSTLAREAAWIGERCEHNTMGDILALLANPAALAQRRTRRGECRTRVARIHLALLEYCYALEDVDPARARFCRNGARGVGWMSALVADEATLDFRTAATHERMRADMRAIAATAASGGDPEPAFIAMLEAYDGETRGGLLPAPPRSDGTATPAAPSGAR